MNTNMLSALKQIIASQGEEILANPQRLKGLVSDYAKNEPKAERLAFGRCIECGFYRELKKTSSPETRKALKTTLAQKLHNDQGLDMAYCVGALDLLEAAVFGTAHIDAEIDTWAPQQYNTAPQYSPSPPATPFPQIPMAQTVTPATTPTGKHTVRNVLLALAAGIVVIVVFVNLRSSAPANYSTNTSQNSQYGANYTGVMTKGSTQLNIQLIIGGFSSGNLVNTYYLYTKYNTPIPLRGSLNGGVLTLTEVDNENAGTFAFANFDINQNALHGVWTNGRDSNDSYTVTLTKY
jgi:hypothetical protein